MSHDEGGNNIEMRIVIIMVPAIVTGVTWCFTNSYLVLRDVVMIRICSSSNQFGSLRSIEWEIYIIKIIFPFEYDQF